MIPAAEIAALDQARAWCDHELSANVERFRGAAAVHGADETLMTAVRELVAGWTPQQLGGMLAVAIARLAQDDLQDSFTGGA